MSDSAAPLGPGPPLDAASAPDFDISVVEDAATYRALCAGATGPRLRVEALLGTTARRGVSERLRRRLGLAPRDGLAGFCRVCGDPVLFSRPSAGAGAPNFREALRCPRCGLNNRQRFTAAYALAAMGDRGVAARQYCYEQVTPFFDIMRERLGERVEGSEYLGPGRPLGETTGGVRHEDAASLTWDDASFDVLVANDVFEHVPDPGQALREARRVLRSGGILLFTVPFHGTDRTEPCTVVRGGVVTHLREPEYHGDPVRSAGCLVHSRFGWDLLDLCRAAGFAHACMLAYYSPLYGHIGGGMQLAFRAGTGMDG